MALVIKTLKEMDFKQSTVNVAFTLVLRICITGLDPEIVKEMKEKMEIRLNEDPIFLTNENSQIRNKGGFLFLTARLNEDVTFQPNLRKWPFDLQEVRMKVELTSTALQDEKTTVRFNLYKHSNTNIMISFKKNVDMMPEYNLAERLTEAKIGQEIKGSLVYFPHVAYTIVLYREPEHMLAAMGLPLILLQLVTLGVFLFTQDEFSNRWNTIVTILVALYAFLPTLYGEIPSSSTSVLLEKLIYMALASVFMVALESVIIHFTQLIVVTYVIFAVTATMWGGTVGYLVYEYSKYLVDKRTKYDLQNKEVKIVSTDFNYQEWHRLSKPDNNKVVI
jgi:hypothetical protein